MKKKNTVTQANQATIYSISLSILNQQFLFQPHYSPMPPTSMNNKNEPEQVGWRSNLRTAIIIVQPPPPPAPPRRRFADQKKKSKKQHNNKKNHTHQSQRGFRRGPPQSPEQRRGRHRWRGNGRKRRGASARLAGRGRWRRPGGGEGRRGGREGERGERLRRPQDFFTRGIGQPGVWMKAEAGGWRLAGRAWDRERNGTGSERLHVGSQRMKPGGRGEGGRLRGFPFFFLKTRVLQGTSPLETDARNSN